MHILQLCSWEVLAYNLFHLVSFLDLHFSDADHRAGLRLHISFSRPESPDIWVGCTQFVPLPDKILLFPFCVVVIVVVVVVLRQGLSTEP